MQAQTEVGAANHARIVVWLEPARAEVDAARLQAGKPALELSAPCSIAGHKDHEIREPASFRRRLPPANALFEARHRLDDHVEVFVLGPARGTDDEADDSAADAQ